MCFRDMTFCDYEDCSRHKLNEKKAGDCFRSYTPEVEEQAKKWWSNSKGDPVVCFFRELPLCYTEE